MSIVIMTLMKTVVFPMLAGDLTALGLSKWRMGGDDARDWQVGLGLLVGFAVGFAGIAGLTLKPIVVSDWLPLMGLLGLITLLIAPQNQRFRIPIIFAVTVLAAWVQMRPLAHLFTGSMHAVWIMGAALLWSFTWLLRDWATAKIDAKENLAGMIVAATAVSLISVLDGSVMIGQMAGVVAATAGSIYLARLAFPGIRVGSVANGVFIILFGSLLTNAWFYVEVSPPSVLLALAAVFAIIPVKMPFYSGLGNLQRQAVVVVSAILPTIAAVVYLLAAASNDGYY